MTQTRLSFITPTRLTACLALAALLGGCGTGGLSTGSAQSQGEVPAEYRDWFGWRPEADIAGDDWQQINRAQAFIEEGRYGEAAGGDEEALGHTAARRGPSGGQRRRGRPVPGP